MQQKFPLFLLVSILNPEATRMPQILYFFCMYKHRTPLKAYYRSYLCQNGFIEVQNSRTHGHRFSQTYSNSFSNFSWLTLTFYYSFLCVGQNNLKCQCSVCIKHARNERQQFPECVRGPESEKTSDRGRGEACRAITF